VGQYRSLLPGANQPKNIISRTAGVNAVNAKPQKNNFPGLPSSSGSNSKKTKAAPETKKFATPQPIRKSAVATPATPSTSRPANSTPAAGKLTNENLFPTLGGSTSKLKSMKIQSNSMIGSSTSTLPVALQKKNKNKKQQNKVKVSLVNPGPGSISAKQNKKPRGAGAGDDADDWFVEKINDPNNYVKNYNQSASNTSQNSGLVNGVHPLAPVVKQESKTDFREKKNTPVPKIQSEMSFPTLGGGEGAAPKNINNFYSKQKSTSSTNSGNSGNASKNSKPNSKKASNKIQKSSNVITPPAHWLKDDNNNISVPEPAPQEKFSLNDSDFGPSLGSLSSKKGSGGLSKVFKNTQQIEERNKQKKLMDERDGYKTASGVSVTGKKKGRGKR